jgi:hypothetical protein
MSHDSPELSVVMCVYNGASHLESAVRSVLCQSFRDFELIVVDDGSTDETPVMLDRFSDEDSRVRVEHRPHAGHVPSLNFGCSIARGAYIARADADDIYLPYRFERQMSFLHANPNVMLLGSECELMAGDGRGTGAFIRTPSGPAIRAALKEGNAFMHPTVVFRRDSFDKLGGYREAFLHAEDYDLWLRLAERYEVDNLPEVLVRYRIHAGQLSQTGTEDQACSALGAQTAARLRRSHGTDEALVSSGQITREILLRFGVVAREIDQMVTRFHLMTAGALLGVGAVPEAVALLRWLVETSDPEKIGRSQTAQIHRTLAVAFVRSGQLASGFVARCKAAFYDPTLVADAARRRLRWRRPMPSVGPA